MPPGRDTVLQRPGSVGLADHGWAAAAAGMLPHGANRPRQGGDRLTGTDARLEKPRAPLQRVGDIPSLEWAASRFELGEWSAAR